MSIFCLQQFFFLDLKVYTHSHFNLHLKIMLIQSEYNLLSSIMITLHKISSLKLDNFSSSGLSLTFYMNMHAHEVRSKKTRYFLARVIRTEMTSYNFGIIWILKMQNNALFQVFRVECFKVQGQFVLCVCIGTQLTSNS